MVDKELSALRQQRFSTLNKLTEEKLGNLQWEMSKDNAYWTGLLNVLSENSPHAAQTIEEVEQTYLDGVAYLDKWLADPTPDTVRRLVAALRERDERIAALEESLLEMQSYIRSESPASEETTTIEQPRSWHGFVIGAHVSWEGKTGTVVGFDPPQWILIRRDDGIIDRGLWQYMQPTDPDAQENE